MMSKPRRPSFAAMLGMAMSLLATMATHETQAGGRLPCSQASVFSGAAVNAVVLPYRYEEGLPFKPTLTGARLSALVQQEILFSMLKYRSVGATELISEDGEVCDVRQVIDRIGGDLRKGSGVVLIWGRIFEQESEVFVQSYVRFFHHGLDNAITVDLAWPDDRRLRLSATLPPQAVAMVPRRFTLEDLKQIEERTAKNLLVRNDHDPDLEGKPLTRSAFEPITYGVIDTAGDWMKIKSRITGAEGWVQVREEGGDWALRTLLPELAYLDGVAAYLRLGAKPGSLEPERAMKVFGWMQRGFAEYETKVGRDAAPQAFGLANVMTGAALWRQPMMGEGRAEAARLFQKALRYLPESASVRQLVAITSPTLGPGSQLEKATLAALDSGLLGALAVEPDNASALQNLEHLYEFGASLEGFGSYEKEDLEKRRKVISEAKAQLAR